MTTKPGGATKPRQFRFTDAEVAEMDEVARLLAQPGVPVTRTTVLRLAFREFRDRQRERIAR